MTKSLVGLLVVAASGVVSAQNTGSLEPYAPRTRFEVLAGAIRNPRTFKTVIVSGRRELVSSMFGISVSAGWASGSPTPFRRGAGGGTYPNYWYANWDQTGEQQFIMLGTGIDAVLPIGADRLDLRAGFGLIPRAYGTHRGTNGQRCDTDYSVTPSTQTCTTFADSVVANATESGNYWTLGVGVRLGSSVVIRWTLLVVASVPVAIQGQRVFTPLMVGFRF